MLTIEDGSKSRRRWENDQRDSEDASQRLGVATGTSNEMWIEESNQVTGSFSQGGGSSGQENINRGQGTTGKVLGQLRELKQAHLNFIDACTGTLQEHRNLFEENMDSLEKEIIEAIGWEEE